METAGTVEYNPPRLKFGAPQNSAAAPPSLVCVADGTILMLP
jgi:hypothetical protein